MDLKLIEAISPVKAAMIDIGIRTNAATLTMNPRPSCKAGCSFCCKRAVRVTTAEAVIMVAWLQQKKLWTGVRAIANEQRHIDANPLAWFKMGLDCPVLDQNTRTCLAYDVRPTVCSTHFAMSPPEGCDPTSCKRVGFKPFLMTDFHKKFANTLAANVAVHGVLNINMPMPTALLFAERVSTKSGMEFEGVISMLFGEFK